MESNNTYEDCAIVCAGIGGWYPKGVQRLRESLTEHGFKGSFLPFNDYAAGWRGHEEVPYGFKIDAIETASKAYRYVLWLDASMYAVNDVSPLFDIIKRDSFYACKTGYNLAQSCNDFILEIGDMDRDDAERLPEVASGVVGFDFGSDKIKQLFFIWKWYRDEGGFNGSRLHDNQSKDPRFLHHRQDQSGLSLAYHELFDGEFLHELGNEVAYNSPNINPKNHILLCQGM